MVECKKNKKKQTPWHFRGFVCVSRFLTRWTWRLTWSAPTTTWRSLTAGTLGHPVWDVSVAPGSRRRWSQAAATCSCASSRTTRCRRKASRLHTQQVGSHQSERAAKLEAKLLTLKRDILTTPFFLRAALFSRPHSSLAFFFWSLLTSSSFLTPSNFVVANSQNAEEA